MFPLVNSTKDFKEEMKPILCIVFQKIDAERIPPDSFCDASITLIPKPDKKGKLQTNISHERLLQKSLRTH